MTVVLNSEALLYLTLDPLKLTTRARRTIEEADRILVPAICIWEIGRWNKSRRIRLPMELKRFARLVSEIGHLELRPIDDQLFMESLDLPWKHADPVDRLVVTLGKMHQCPLITQDKRLHKYYKNCIW